MHSGGPSGSRPARQPDSSIWKQWARSQNWRPVDSLIWLSQWQIEKLRPGYTGGLVKFLCMLDLGSVQFSHSVMPDSLRPHESQHTRPLCPSPTPEFTQTHVHQVGNAIQPSHPLSSSSPPAPNPSQHQGLFQWVKSSHEVAKVLQFQLQYQSYEWTPGLISFRMDWVDLFAVQGTLKSPFQHRSSKLSIFQHSAFFMVQLSHPYKTTGKTVALTRDSLCWESNVSVF